MPRLRILLAEDHALIREGIRMLVDAQPDMVVVGQASDGLEACERAAELRPDVAVLDLSLPELNGVRAAERIRRTCPEVKVLALTVHEDESYLRQLLKAGGSGYLLKRAAASELTHAIRTVAAGGTYLDPSLARDVVDGYIRRPNGADGPHENPLTDREVEVLRLVALGYTNKELGAQLHISVKTVETHKARLMEKLHLRSRADLVRYALRKGWLHPAD